ncbi:MAG: AbrB/MazE/SpoVT family DNA-binding domain-containing protein [Candidatus Jidaibacter sp.]|jgi:AbrB family looped-hinge helix DNA binding protein|nr:AbrB/MazE/SpoVT family DNA-binding domain-containing protein [Candidatus Jidaibacter sp.]
MEIRAILSSKGQLVIPKQLRQMLGLHVGSELQIHLRRDNVMEVKPVKHNITEFFGQGARQGVDVQNIDDAIEQAILENN